MRFFKKHSYDIVRLFIIQIGMTIFGLVVTTAMNTAFSGTGAAFGKLAASIFSLVFYLFIIYTTAWEYGSKRQSEKEDAGYGWKTALFANVPNLFFALLMLVGLFRLVAPNSFFIGLYGVAQLLAGLFEAMHLGLIQFILPQAGNARFVISAIYYLLSSVPCILVAHIAYTFGRKNLRVTKATPPSLD